MYQPNLFENPAITDRFWFDRQLNGLTLKYGAWLKDLGFHGEIALDDFLSVYGSALTASETRKAEKMIAEWSDICEQALKEQICFDCRNYTPIYLWHFYAGALRCEECIKKLNPKWKRH